MKRVAVIEKAKTNISYKSHFDFPFEQFALTSLDIKKLLKKDIDIQIDPSQYDYIICVGAEVVKYFDKFASVVSHQGCLINDRYIPLTSPYLAKLKPETKPAFDQAIENIKKYVRGESVTNTSKYSKILISDEDEAVEFLEQCLRDTKSNSVVGIDTETSDLYCRKGRLLGVSLCWDTSFGIYIDAYAIDDRVEDLLKKIISTRRMVLHNAKFDKHWIKYHLNIEITNYDDTMILHYLLNENEEHGLKALTIKYTDLGDYDRELEIFKKKYCKQHKIREKDFSYEFIPFEILGDYAALDTVATLLLYNKFWPILSKSENLLRCYTELMLPASDFLTDMENNGVPLDREALIQARDIDLADEIFRLEESMYEFKAIKLFEENTGVKFNANSVQHLRQVFFDILDLPLPDKVTATGAISTDKEVLEELSDVHPLPKLILQLKQLKKIKSTYIDKMLMHIDSDSRLRTGFNLCTTTSGRLSSSGTLNLQQLPRDYKVVKRAIKARPGYKIVSQDLATAEMYVAACLSGDKELQDVFSSGGDFHSSIAKKVFKLQCPIDQVKELYKGKRQAAKAVSFGILFGAGPQKVADTAEIPLYEAKDAIEDYFKTFFKLKNHIDTRLSYIKTYGATYSVFGRKRRLKNVFSDNREIAGHASRSGFNFEIQSVASDINLIAATELNKWIKENNKDIKIFALVHDSIVAEVREDLVEEYCAMMKYFTQKDRGVMIPGCPIGVDQEIGTTYAFEDN